MKRKFPHRFGRHHPMSSSTRNAPIRYSSGFSSRLHHAVPTYMIAIWAFYLLLSPFYVFLSGLPQPADIVLILGIIPAAIVAFVKRSMRIEPVFLAGFSFAILTLAINLIYYAFFFERQFLFASMFYVYNFMAFCFVIFLFQRSPFFMNQITYYAIAATVVIQFCVVLFFDSAGFRHEGTFNNPNQLAYWSLLMAAMLIVLKRSTSLNLVDMALFTLLAYIQTQSLSKAGLIAFGLLVLFMAFSPVTNKKLKAVFLLLLCVFTITKVTAPVETRIIIHATENIDAVTQRLSDIGVDRDDSAMGRGYARLIDYPQYLLTGAGEGAHWRFNARQELHSGIATILFSYGFIGFILFATFLVLIFKRLPLYYGLILVTIVLYGLTHQNFRNTGFWIFLALSYSYVFFKEETESRKDLLKKKHRLDFFISKSE